MRNGETGIWRAVRAACPVAVAVAVLMVLAVPVSAQPFNVALYTSNLQSMDGKITFDIVAEDGFNTFTSGAIYDFTTGGTIGPAETEGGLIEGDLILGTNPAFFTSIQAQSYYNHLGVPLTPIGGSTTFGIELSAFQTAPTYPDQFSIYLLDSLCVPLVATADPTGASALFTIDWTDIGPVLAVFDPVMFSAPDSIILTLGTLAVDDPDGTPRYLRFRGVYPNPAPRNVTIRFDVPEGLAEVTLEVFDIRGARVATLARGPFEVGVHDATWKGVDDRGNRMSPGMYMLRLVTDRGHYVARKVMLTR